MFTLFWQILIAQVHRGDEEILLYSIHLYTLQRSAIQLIDPSLSSQSYCFVIHARLRESSTKSYEMRKMPIYLALETRLQMEVWFVLLRCHAMPELYGPPSINPFDAFRCHRSLSLKIMEARRLHRPVNSGDSIREKEMDTYCEILIEGEIRGKTSVKKGTLKPLWTEDFEFTYLPVQQRVVTDLVVIFLSISTMFRFIYDISEEIEIYYLERSPWISWRLKLEPSLKHGIRWFILPVM